MTLSETGTHSGTCAAAGALDEGRSRAAGRSPAINHRWLLKSGSATKQRQSPEWQAVEAENLTRVSANLAPGRDREGASARFQIRFHGAMIARVYGAPRLQSKYLDEVIPPKNHGPALRLISRPLKDRPAQSTPFTT